MYIAPHIQHRELGLFSFVEIKRNFELPGVWIGGDKKTSYRRGLLSFRTNPRIGIAIDTDAVLPATTTTGSLDADGIVARGEVNADRLFRPHNVPGTGVG